ncbi:MAG: SAP domain-containing protein [Deltaproteobacteria bacterium]|nr:SAP domain-containing protein [Deltaproteobacteria bacterium]
MNMNEIKRIARLRGLNPGRLKKVDLIRTLQREEGNESCFQTGQADTCDQDQCLWRGDCLK